MISEKAALATLPSSGFLHDYVLYAASCTDANAAYHLAGGLVLLSQVLPLDLGLPLGGRQLRGNLYSLCVGPSTFARKSTGVDVAKGILEDAGFDTVMEAPGSAEALLDSIRGRQGPSLIVYPEFGSFLSQTEMKYAIPIRMLLTDAFDCPGTLGRALVKKQLGAVKNPRVSVFGGVTLDLLETHTSPVDWTGGFLARFFTMYATAERDYSLQPPNPPGRKELVSRFLTFTLLDGAASPGECLGFDAAARGVWDDWYYDCKKKTLDGARQTAAGIQRAFSMAQKVSLLLAYDFGTARSGRPWYISPRELEPAINIVNLHIESMLEIGDHLAPNRDFRDRLSVLHALHHDRPLTLGRIITKSKVGLKKRVLELLDTLAEEGAVRRVSANDGRTDLYFRVNGVPADAAEDVSELAVSAAPLLEGEGEMSESAETPLLE